ncbi:bifunctional ligase/repressor BirA [Elysia marginata]|uniref:Bifunctional ligase/repressor BirA n=1 Tax=Elysia marginata TaxID=1093978 RepID=A0AAV4HIJ6_9GAST|nr:bifunctional ligase/repressor BirA [Elysia marginata]
MATFEKDVFSTLLETKFVARTLIYTDVTGSTMDYARRLAHQVSEHPHGSAVLSERQTKARGARDHKWDASNTENIYVSFILHLPAYYKTFEGRFDLEVAACLSVMHVARKFGVTAAAPKWPNDVWVRGHKLAGFLVEDGRFNVPGSLNCLIILGMGINVNSDVRRNPELSSIATSIKCERGGRPVNREQFFADVCARLEHNLEQTRATNLDIFRQENVFREAQDISAFCPSEGPVIDGKFLEICDNWDVRFSDKTEKMFQGRSDQYTIRPKVLNKILIIFTTFQATPGSDKRIDARGGAGNSEDISSIESAGIEDTGSQGGVSRQSAQHLATILQSLVDTSRYVVCLVPESLVTDTCDWMKTCSLLVLPEPLTNPGLVSSKLDTFLNSGGRALASGMGSLFLAKSLHIPLKEVLIQPSHSHSDTRLVQVTADLPVFPPDHRASPTQQLTTGMSGVSVESTEIFKSYCEDPRDCSAKTSANSASVSASSTVQQTETIVFPASSVCFQFFEDEKAMLAESSTSFQDKQDKAGLVSADSAYSQNKTKVWAVYRGTEGTANLGIAACSVKPHVNEESCVTLVGFDIGAELPSLPSGTGQVSDEMRRVSEDRFKREVLIQQMVDSLLKCQ